MTKAELNGLRQQYMYIIELSEYINDYLRGQNCPDVEEHIAYAIEGFYNKTYMEALDAFEEEQANFELEQRMNVNESEQLGLYK